LSLSYSIPFSVDIVKKEFRKELGSSRDYFVCLISQNSLLSSLKLKKKRKEK
jgi:hypothetical protein